jgi:hypothetical protein
MASVTGWAILTSRGKPPIRNLPVGQNRISQSPPIVEHAPHQISILPLMGAEMTQQDYDAAIAAFVRTKGVTRCPTACAVPTQASVAETDRQALRRRAEEHEAKREERKLREAAIFRFGAVA